MRRLTSIITFFSLLIFISCTSTHEPKIVYKSSILPSNFSPAYSGIKVVYYENGKKKAETSYEDGKLEGESIIWEKNGQLRAKEVFDDGKRDESYTSWYSNGHKKVEGKYDNGKRKGKWTWWDEKGEVSYELCYDGC